MTKGETVTKVPRVRAPTTLAPDKLVTALHMVPKKTATGDHVELTEV